MGGQGEGEASQQVPFGMEIKSCHKKKQTRGKFTTWFPWYRSAGEGPQGPDLTREGKKEKGPSPGPERLRTAPEGTGALGLGLLGAVQPPCQSALSHVAIGRGLPWPPSFPPPSCLGFTSPKYTGPTLWSNRSCNGKRISAQGKTFQRMGAAPSIYWPLWISVKKLPALLSTFPLSNWSLSMPIRY